MRIEQMEHVAAVVRLGSYRRAAEELHISQPALSESIRSLERELGVTVLERGRHGARVSTAGRDLLPHLRTVLDSFDRLRQAADEQHRNARVVRVGTVNAATVPVLTAAIGTFRTTHPETHIEVINARQADINRSLLEGSLDLGLVNYLDGDDQPPELESMALLSGLPVVCLRPDDPLADLDAVPIAELGCRKLIMMRSGYLMHRYLHRMLGGEVPSLVCSADGAEMGKVFVAQGLGVTVLPDYSVAGDPLERAGVITWRPIADEDTKVHLVIHRLSSNSPSRATQDLYRILIEQARAVAARSMCH
ncbi:MAG: LysR family transcriptional regulator [Streptosporangiaceae bacterium]